jgi:glycosyltransferase involved in cell wall biosynthesis
MTILSIIIPTFNRKELLRYTLESLDKKFHTGVEFEVIIVDDRSTDDTVHFVRENYPSLKMLFNKGRGAAAARNTGLSAAQGEYILYLDSDDLIGENYFREKIKYLEHNDDVGAVYGTYDFFASDAEFSPEKIIFRHKYPQIAPGEKQTHISNNLAGNFLPPNAIIWRKAFLVKLAGHDETLGVNQDVDLLIRGLFAGLKLVAVSDGTRVYIRDHSLDNRVGNVGSSQEKWRQILQLRKKIYVELKQNGYGSPENYRSLSAFLFGFWKSLRHKSPEIAAEYLETAKEIYWPLQINGNIVFRTLAKVIGPVNAVKIKYSLLKRD